MNFIELQQSNLIALGLTVKDYQLFLGEEPLESNGKPFKLFHKEDRNNKDVHWFNPFVDHALRAESASMILFKALLTSNLSTIAMQILVSVAKLKASGGSTNTSINKMFDKITSKASVTRFNKLSKAYSNGEFKVLVLTSVSRPTLKGKTYGVGAKLASPLLGMLEQETFVSNTGLLKYEVETIQDFLSSMGMGLKTVSNDENFDTYVALISAYNGVLKKLKKFIKPLKAVDPDIWNSLPLQEFVTDIDLTQFKGDINDIPDEVRAPSVQINNVDTAVSRPKLKLGNEATRKDAFNPHDSNPPTTNKPAPDAVQTVNGTTHNVHGNTTPVNPFAPTQQPVNPFTPGNPVINPFNPQTQSNFGSSEMNELGMYID